MCGPYAFRTDPETAAGEFGLGTVPDLTPRYNLAPTQLVAAVRLGKDRVTRGLVRLRWGLAAQAYERASLGGTRPRGWRGGRTPRAPCGRAGSRTAPGRAATPTRPQLDWDTAPRSSSTRRGNDAALSWWNATADVRSYRVGYVFHAISQNAVKCHESF